MLLTESWFATFLSMAQEMMVDLNINDSSEREIVQQDECN